MLPMMMETELLNSPGNAGLRVGKTQGLGVVGSTDGVAVAGGPVVGELVISVCVIVASVVGIAVVAGDVGVGIVVVTGHGPELHARVSFLGPTQSEPLLIGGGLVQLR